MRFLVGGIAQESNTFCPQKTTMENFALVRGEEMISKFRKSSSFIGGVIDTAEELGVQLYPTMHAAAYPYGTVEEETFDLLLDELLKRIDEAGEIDGVVLCLHGGMVAENSLDPEGEILVRLREKVGKVPIVSTLDMHSNISQRMIENCDAFFANNENPHLDSYDRGYEATKVLSRIVKRELEPVMVLRKPGMLPPTLHINPPHSGPMVKVFKKAFEMEKDPRVININVTCGFPWSDTPYSGMAVITVVDKDKELAEELAQELSDMLWEFREEFIPHLPSVNEAVERAMKAEEGPVILVDVADNPGDGTTEDSTSILKSLIEHGAKDVAFALIHDPPAVEKCIAAGVGNRISLYLGCKVRLFGEPAILHGTVKTITDGVFWHLGPLYGGFKVHIGRTTVVDADGIEIIITENTYGPNDPEIFRRNGIEPSRKKILVVKTFKMHMEPNYRPFAKQIIEVEAPGQASVNMKSFKWTCIPRPMYPIDDI